MWFTRMSPQLRLQAFCVRSVIQRHEMEWEEVSSQTFWNSPMLIIPVTCRFYVENICSAWKVNEKYFNTVWPILMYRSHTTYLYTQNKDNISILKYKLWEKLRVRISGKRMRMVGRGLSLFTFHFYCLNDLKITMLYLVRNFLLFSLLLIYF